MRAAAHHTKGPKASPPAAAEALTPTSSAQKQQQRPPRVPKENVDPNSILASAAQSPSPAKSFQPKTKSPLPPRPPPSPPLSLKRNLNAEFPSEDTACIGGPSDSGVQVLVRIRPSSDAEEETIVEKLSPNAVSISGHYFMFDSVVNSTSSQADIFNLVGVPLVENCLAGFNSSIFAYGQTGSGKTYTMWGPANALTEDTLEVGLERGLTPRVFERLFSRIQEEEARHADKQMTHQCCCSFLEIYNEQITDLLDPTQRNLQIREDSRTGVYVEYLTEEPVCSTKDVTRLLLKGLANRRTGATSVNAESSRSHCVFTCIIRSQFKNTEDGRNGARISRINLVDLAGSERQKLTNTAGDRLKEAGNINRSLSQLGNLINILAEVSQSGKHRHIPYRDSKLTFFLQESLGGNAKLAMICAVSPSASCKNESLSTLRFAKRAKAIKNQAVVNEITEDDVNILRAQIQHLKDELQRVRSLGVSSEGDGGYSTGQIARRSLSLLRMSLSRPTALPTIRDDSDEEMEIDDVEGTLRGSSLAAHENDDAGVAPQNSSPVANYMDNEKLLKRKSQEQGCGDLLSPELSSSFARQVCRKKCPRTFSNSVSALLNVTAESRLSNDVITTANLAASLNRGLELIRHQQTTRAVQRASVGLVVNPVNMASVLKAVRKVDVAVQTDLYEQDSESSAMLGQPANIAACSDLQMVLVDDVLSETEKTANQSVLKAMEKVLAGAIRREMALDEQCAKQRSQISELGRLVQYYKHERECNTVISQVREDKILRLEALVDGVMSKEQFMDEEFVALENEHKILRQKFENNPEVQLLNVEMTALRDELDGYKSYFEMGERGILLEEIQDLKNYLKNHVQCSSTAALQLTLGCDQTEHGEAGGWTERESKWITLTEELRMELEKSRSLAEKLAGELDSEKKCTRELNEALQTAVKGHVRLLEQYADLQEKHMTLLATHRRIGEGIEDVKKAAARAGVKGKESRFINSLAAQVSLLRAERERERQCWTDENRSLRDQLRDAGDAVQAAGEVVVRLKEAEGAALLLEKRALRAEQETEKAYVEIENLRRDYEMQIQLLSESTPVAATATAKYDTDGSHDQQSSLFHHEEGDGQAVSPPGVDPSSWFLGYDRCNI